MSHARPLAPTAAALGLLYAACAVLVWSGQVARAPDLMGAGIVLDLTLTASVATYFLAIRPGLLPRWTLLMVVAAGAGTAHLLLPPEARAGLNVLVYAWAAAEGARARAAARRRRAGALRVGRAYLGVGHTY